MANLQADSQGFIIGDSITSIRRSQDTLSAMQADIAAIKRAVISSVNHNAGHREPRQERILAVPNTRHQEQRQVSSVADRHHVEPIRREPSRDSLGRFISTRASETATPSGNRSTRTAGVVIPFINNQAAVTPSTQVRDNSGRFTSNNDGPNLHHWQNGDNRKNVYPEIQGFANRVVGAITESSHSLEEVDPSVRAANEIAQPLARTYQVLTGGNSGDSKWLKKIFSLLKITRQDSTLFQRTATRTLGHIEDNTEDDNGSGSQSFIGGLLGSISPWVLSAITGIGTALLAGIGTVLGVIFSPIGAAIGAAATVAWGVFTEDGRKFFADIGGKISGAWDTAIGQLKPVFEAIQAKWDESVKFFTDLWEPIGRFISDKLGIIGKVANKANNFIKEKTGIDVKESAVSAKNKVSDTASKANNFIREKTGIDVKKSATTDIVTPAINSIGKGISARWNDAKGFLGRAADMAGINPGLLAKIANFESGFNSEASPVRKDGTKISSAHGYGQFLDSTWTEMLNKHGDKYGVENAGNLSKKDALKLRSDKELQAAMLAEFTKENVEIGRKLGGSNDDANIYALHNLGANGGADFLKALKNNPDAPVNSVLSKKVISGNKALYGNGKISLQEAYSKMGKAMSRGEVFSRDISNLIESPVNLASMQTTSFPVPSMPTMAKPAPIPEAVPIAAPLNSQGNDKRPISVIVERGDVGQDLSDRRIGHVASGGLSGS
jgi:hypothetical protein